MKKITVKQISLCFILFATTIKEILSERDTVCPSIKSTRYEITWPSAVYVAKSYPLCLNEAKEFVYRKCVDGNWEEEPKCSYVQNVVPPECPQEFTDDGTFCYIVSKEECPFNDVLPFDSYKHVISANNLGPVLMPLKRNELHSFQWTEISSLYKLLFDEAYFDSDNIYKDKCLLFYNTSYIAAVSCEEPHSKVCAYDKLSLSSNQLCGKESCFEKDFMSRTKCICMRTPEEYLLSKAEFVDIYQNVVYEKLTNQSCTIGLEKTSDGKYVWTDSKQEIDYTLWSPATIFQPSYKYGATTSKGWILTKSELSCILVQKDVDDIVPTLELTFDKTDNNFTLVATGRRNLKRRNSYFLVYCFTDAHPTELLYRFFPLEVTYDSDDVTIFGFKALEFGPGHYWCEGFTYSNLSRIATDVILYRQKNFSEFVGIFYLNFTTQQNIFNLTSLFPLGPMKRQYISRVMEVVPLDSNSTQTLINMHFSSQSEQVLNIETEYNLLKEAVNGSSWQLIDFLSTDFCVSITDKFKWPTTAVRFSTTSEEFCFLSNGNRPVRYCDGTFIDGALWSSFDTACDTPELSPVSPNLLSLLNNQSLEVVTTICAISNEFDKLNSFDIYLIGKLFDAFDFSELYMSKQGEVFEILDNLLKLDKNLLRESQLKMKATDIILNFVDSFIGFKDAPDLSIIKSNYVLISSASQNISGISVQKDKSKGVVVKILKEDFSFEDIDEIDKLECLLWLSPKLRLQLREGDKISILLYRNSGFFTETITNIFSLQFSTNIVNFEGPVKVVHKVEANNLVNIYCVYWYFDDYLRGSWNRDNQVKINQDFHVCEFWHTGNLGLIGTEMSKNANVTTELTYLLYNNYTIVVTMHKLENISERFEEFAEHDVFLFGQILKKVELTKEEVNLHVLAQAVGNLLKIDKQVLQESQKKSRATDIILANVDGIVKSSTQQFGGFGSTQTNFLIYRINVESTNFSGLVVFSDSQNPELLNDEVNSTVIFADNVEGAVVLSPELKSQLWNNSDIAIIVFFNDLLFNNSSSPKPSNLIFGVILPDVGEFIGPVSTYYRLNEVNNTPMCVHWFYNPSINISGFWKNDTVGQLVSSLVRCDYWHTTHLGLLLLEEDKYEDTYNLMKWANVTGSFLSFFGFSGIMLTAVLFKKWRENKGNQLLLNFVLSIIILLVIYCIAIQVENAVDSAVCITIGAFLHYATLSQFSWMFIIGILQLKRFVLVFGSTPKYLVLKACIFGWGLPLPFVLFVVISPNTSYINEYLRFCYPSGLGLYVGIWVPAGIILSFNLGAFFYILYSVCDRKIECGVSVVKGNEILHQRRLAVLLFFLLGITWIFGLLANLDFGLIFIYLFNFTASFQGFVIFLYFIVLNKTTRDMYVNAFKKRLRRNY